MRTLVPRSLLLMSSVVWALGCSSGEKPGPSSAPATTAAPAAAPSTPAAIKSATGNGTVASSAPAGGAPASGSPQTGSSKTKTSRSPDKKSKVPDNADPKTVYVVSGVGQPMDITATNGVTPTNQYQVAYADSKSNSTIYSVESMGAATQGQTLIGKGSPKPGFSLPKGFTEYKPTGYDDSGLPLRIVCAKTGKLLALIPGGPSIVGSDDAPGESQPSYNVVLDSFYMEIQEVTVDDYEKYRSELKEKKKPSAPAPSNPNADPDFPALGVSWAGAQGYVRWAGLELPTEAEFEKAARGPKGFRTPWGDGKPLATTKRLTKVGSNREDTSPYGVLDLAANAKEWCADLYSPTANAEAAAAGLKDVLHNWQGPKKVREMNLRVVKGNGPDWSLWHREGHDMQKVNPQIGFRGVLRLTGETSDTKDPKDPKATPKSKKAAEKGF